jgi:chromosome segregation ATPase
MIVQGETRLREAASEHDRLRDDLRAADERFGQAMTTKDQEATLLKQEIEFSRQETSRVTAELHRTQHEVSVERSNFQNAEREIHKLRSSILDLEKRIAASQEEHRRLESLIEAADGENLAAKLKMGEVESELQDSRQTIRAGVEERALLQSLISASDQKRLIADAEIERLNAELYRLRETLQATQGTAEQQNAQLLSQLQTRESAIEKLLRDVADALAGQQAAEMMFGAEQEKCLGLEKLVADIKAEVCFYFSPLIDSFMAAFFHNLFSLIVFVNSCVHLRLVCPISKL